MTENNKSQFILFGSFWGKNDFNGFLSVLRYLWIICHLKMFIFRNYSAWVKQHQ